MKSRDDVVGPTLPPMRSVTLRSSDLSKILGSKSDRARDIVRQIDSQTDAALDHLRGRPVPDRVGYVASELGNFSLIWHTLSVARGLRRGGDIAGTARLSTGLAIEAALVNGPIKSLFRRQRPSTVVEVLRPHALRQPTTSSFPSGHASAAAFFVVVASQDDPWWPLYVTIAGVVASSRVYVKIHHASDVIGGVVVGAALGVAFRRLWRCSGPTAGSEPAAPRQE